MFGCLLAVPRLRRVAPDQKREDSSALGSIIFAVIPRGAGTRDEPLKLLRGRLALENPKRKTTRKSRSPEKGKENKPEWNQLPVQS